MSLPLPHLTLYGYVFYSEAPSADGAKGPFGPKGFKVMKAAINTTFNVSINDELYSELFC